MAPGRPAGLQTGLDSFSFPSPRPALLLGKGVRRTVAEATISILIVKKNTFTNENALKCHAGSCKLKSGSPRKSERTTTEPDPVVLYQDSDLEKVLGTSGPFALQVKIIFSLDSFLK